MIAKTVLLITLWKLAGLTGSTSVGPVALQGEEIPYETWHAMVMPGGLVRYDAPAGTAVYLDSDRQSASGNFDAPETPGVYDLEFRTSRGETAYEIALFVLTPASEIDATGSLNGFDIGEYSDREPEGFICIEDAEQDVRVSPHFQIEQFARNQQPGKWPKCLLISSPNVERLEILLSALNRDGITDADTLEIMSGFRTPNYNTGIGSSESSRHLFGDATDIYVDFKPRDGVMDDLNRDGKVDKQDADFLLDYATALFASLEDAPRGGLGSYAATTDHGPFLHVDGRGTPVQWGRD